MLLPKVVNDGLEDEDPIVEVELKLGADNVLNLGT